MNLESDISGYFEEIAEKVKEHNEYIAVNKATLEISTSLKTTADEIIKLSNEVAASKKLNHQQSNRPFGCDLQKGSLQETIARLYEKANSEAASEIAKAEQRLTQLADKKNKLEKAFKEEESKLCRFACFSASDKRVTDEALYQALQSLKGHSVAVIEITRMYIEYIEAKAERNYSILSLFTRYFK